MKPCGHLLIHLAITFFILIGQDICFILIDQDSLCSVQDTDPEKGKKAFIALFFMSQLSSGLEINNLLKMMWQAGVHMVKGRMFSDLMSWDPV